MTDAQKYALALVGTAAIIIGFLVVMLLYSRAVPQIPNTGNIGVTTTPETAVPLESTY